MAGRHPGYVPRILLMCSDLRRPVGPMRPVDRRRVARLGHRRGPRGRLRHPGRHGGPGPGAIAVRGDGPHGPAPRPAGACPPQCICRWSSWPTIPAPPQRADMLNGGVDEVILPIHLPGRVRRADQRPAPHQGAARSVAQLPAGAARGAGARALSAGQAAAGQGRAGGALHHRPAHARAERPLLPRHPGARVQDVDPLRPAAEPADAGRRPLQAGQRHLRASHRRLRAEGAGRHPPAARAAVGRGGPHGRGGVRHPPAQGRAQAGGQVRPSHPQGGRRPLLQSLRP